MMRKTVPFGNETAYTEHMTCSKETKELIMNDCVQEYLKHNPKEKGRNVTQGFMLKRLAMHYVERL